MVSWGALRAQQNRAGSLMAADWQEPNQKGVLYYLKDGRVRGVLLWNVWDQVDNARALIQEPRTSLPPWRIVAPARGADSRRPAAGGTSGAPGHRGRLRRHRSAAPTAAAP